MKRVLVLSPHPDDEAIGCGGALRAYADAGDSVEVLFLTSGEKGGHGLSQAETKRVREDEAAVAAGILGVHTIDFWREPDGGLRAADGLVERLRRRLEATRPDVVFAPHHGDGHIDHQATARLLDGALSAISDVAPEVYLYEVWTPLQAFHQIVDITSVLPTKLAAVRAYKSQCDVMRLDDAVQGLNRYRGEMFNWPGRGYAEVFARRVAPTSVGLD